MTIGSENETSLVLSNQPILASCIVLVLYIFTIGLISSQNIRLGRIALQNQNKLSILANVELALFFIAYYFILGIPSRFAFQNFLFAGTFSIIISILLYLGGLAAFYHSQNRLRYGERIAFINTKLQISLLIPFFLPFLIYKFLSDLAMLIPWDRILQITGIAENSYEETYLILLAGFVFIAILLIVMPLAIVYFWKCNDLEESTLKNRLIVLCQKAKFKYAGLKTWEVMQDSMTAAIIGVWGRFRYVMFTPGLLQKLSPNAIEAVLAHEIGHSKNRHLLIYPFIVSGIFIASSFLASMIYAQMMSVLENHLVLSIQVWNLLNALMFFIFFALILGILFRLVFGYYTRLFERQADLYIFELGIPSANLIEALNELAIASGHIHDVPNWHHYSIRQRINFLINAENSISVINSHHRKVMLSLMAYFICLACLIYIIFFNH